MIDIHYDCPQFRDVDPYQQTSQYRDTHERYLATQGQKERRKCIKSIAEDVSKLLVPRRSYILIYDLDEDCANALIDEMREQFDDLHPDSEAFDAAFERAYKRHYRNPSRITFKAVPYLLGDITHADPDCPEDSVQIRLQHCCDNVQDKKLKERYWALIYRENAEIWAKKAE
jgi:hypothetical protein